MTVQELDQLILDILEVRTQYLLLQDAAKIDRCRMLLSVAKSIHIECWDFSNLHMNRSEAVSHHLEHSVQRRLKDHQEQVLRQFEEFSEHPDRLARMAMDVAQTLKAAENRIQDLLRRNSQHFRYETSIRIEAIFAGDDYLVGKLESEERFQRQMNGMSNDLDEGEDDELVDDELNVDDRRLLKLLSDPHVNLDPETRASLEREGVDLTGANYNPDDSWGN